LRLRLPLRGGLYGFNPRRPLEIAGSLLVANAGDLANITLMAYFTVFLIGHPEALALIPSMGALRGAIVTSMAARVSTQLHLGTLEPGTREILSVEGGRVLALAMAAGIYAGIVTSIFTGLPGSLLVFIAFLSGAAAILVLAPAAAWLAAWGFRKGLDPDSTLAPLLTVLGDMTTVPSLVVVALIAGRAGDPGVLLASLAFTYATLTILIVLARRGHGRVLAEAGAALAMVGVLEAFTGGQLVGYSEALLALGVLHAVPSIMEDVGAASSVLASKLSTLVHLEGPGLLALHAPAKTLETLLGALPSLLVLSAITLLTAGLAGVEADAGVVLRLVAGGGVVAILAYSLVAYVLVVASHRLGLDPDNIVVPLLTALVDAGLIPLLLLYSQIAGLA